MSRGLPRVVTMMDEVVDALAENFVFVVTEKIGNVISDELNVALLAHDKQEPF